MSTVSQKRPVMLLWAAIVIVIIILSGLIASFIALKLGWLPNPWLRPAPPEASARFYPDDTLAYAWFTLNPGEEQRENMLEVWDTLEGYSAFRNWSDEVEDDIFDETGLAVEGIASWMGPDISFGIMDLDIDSLDTDAAMTIDVRDSKAARDYLFDLMDYLEDESSSNFDRHSSGGFDVWVDSNDDSVFALSDDLLVVATSERALDNLLERMTSEDEASLYNDAFFIAARATLPERRFISVYVSGERAIAVVEDSSIGEYVDSRVYEGVPDWVASSAGWVDRGIVIDVIAPHPANYDGRPSGDITDAARVMPNDTIGMLALNFDPVVQNWRDALEEYDFSELGEDVTDIDELRPYSQALPFDPANVNLAHALDFALLSFDVMTGVDLEKDFFAFLEGDLILGVREFDVSAVSNDPQSTAIDAATLLSYSPEHEQSLGSTLDDFLDWLYSFTEIDVSTVDVGAERDAKVVELDGIPYSPGYILHEGYLTVGTTEGMLERIVALQNGGGDSLATDEEYLRATAHLGQSRTMLLYLDLHDIVRISEGGAPDISGSQHRLLQDSLGSFAMETTADETYYRIKSILTLFPDIE